MSSKNIKIEDLKVGVDDIESLHVKLRVKSEEFNVQKNIIFKGKVSIVNGRFTYSFVVPKDIKHDVILLEIRKNLTGMEIVWNYSHDLHDIMFVLYYPKITLTLYSYPVLIQVLNFLQLFYHQP